METRGVGHVVLKVRDLEKSAKFYQDVFGLKEVARLGKQMAFFSFGKNHHDLGLMALGSQAPAANPYATGLYHVAFRIGNNIEDLRKFKKHLEDIEVPLLGMSDHKVSQSLYLKDPDGIELEAYVDADPSVWKDDPSAVAVVDPLILD